MRNGQRGGSGGLTEFREVGVEGVGPKGWRSKCFGFFCLVGGGLGLN